jgi:hypothetical protein
MGFFGFDSTSQKAEDRRIAASDAAKVAAEKSTFVESGALLVGSKGIYVAPGSLQAGKNLELGNVSATEGGTVYMGMSEAGLSGLVDKITTASGAQIASAQQAASDQQAAQLGLVGELAAKTTTNKTLAYLAAGALALAALLGLRALTRTKT